MADTLDNGKFWLPSEFLAGDDIHLLMGNKNLHKHGHNSALGANYGFPTEFPYDFRSYDSPVESLVGSTETESDEEDLVAGLTRQLARSKLQEKARRTTSAPQNLENPWLLSGSPQSTLCAVGSWSDRSAVSSNGSPNGPSQVPSPPTSPLGGKNDAWNLIHEAAGHVARLKMNGEGPPEGTGLLVPNQNLTHVHRPYPPATNANTGFYANQCFSDNFPQTVHLEHARQDQMLKQQRSSMWGRQTREVLFCPRNTLQQQVLSESRGVRVLGDGGGGGLDSNHKSVLPSSAWLPALHQNQLNLRGDLGMRAFFPGGSGVKKRECAGTGVFLPRTYGHTSESSKKPGTSTALLPARVVQGLNKNFHDTTSQAQAQARAQPAYGTLMARRNAMLTHQRNAILKQRSQGPYNHELLCLPQEWTY